MSVYSKLETAQPLQIPIATVLIRTSSIKVKQQVPGRKAEFLSAIKALKNDREQAACGGRQTKGRLYLQLGVCSPGESHVTASISK